MPDGKVGIRGYAAVYDQVAYGEVVRSGAFDKTVSEQDDVRFLVNHDGVPIARTKSGTIDLSLDKKGLIADAPDLDPANPTVAELVSAMGRGDIDQMSFAFSPMRWSEYLDEETDQYVFELLEVRLWDVSVVTYPWYDETSAELELDRALRALHDGRPLTADQRRLLAERVTDEQPVERHQDQDPPVPAPEPAPVRRSVKSIDRMYDLAV
jgi:HK97 family phage prohead protease